MRFINKSANSVNLSDIDKIIPFLNDQEQEIETDLVKRSKIFQNLVLSNPPTFQITHSNNSRIEQNLLTLQSSPSVEPAEPIKCTFRGHVAGNTGYSKANRNIFLALARQGLDMCLQPAQGTGGTNDEQLLKRFLTIPDPDSIVIHSTIPTFATNERYRYSILYTTIESASIPQQFIDSCENYDEVWVTSDFCANVLIEHGLEKLIFVIPNSVNSNNYNERAKPHRFNPPLKPFRFVSVASWSHRKGFDVLLKSYLKEFTAEDPVSLLLVTPYNVFPDGNRKYTVENEINAFINQYGGDNHAHIARSGYPIPEDEMPRIYRACDAFVLPTRGEGFGLPFMEASLCGLPVISTNHSGQTMFLNKENSYLVDIDRLSRMGDQKTGVHYWDGQLFPELTDDTVVSEFGRLMRYVFENKDVAVDKNRSLQDTILSQYSCEIVGAQAKQRLEEIWKQL